jgi:hypothetical protein
MQACEGALRVSALHRSADDLQSLLVCFFAAQRQAGLIQGDAVSAPTVQAESRPTLKKNNRAPRRIPGLARKLG